MKYENPGMEIEEFDNQGIVVTSLGQGGTAQEGNEPGVDF